MTGYGKSEYLLCNKKYIVEIRSLNGKNADISLKTSSIPRDREMNVRQYIAKKLYRGNIDLFITSDKNETENARNINTELAAVYLQQIRNLEQKLGTEKSDGADLIGMILKMPDVIETVKEEIDDESWNVVFSAIENACSALDDFRTKEGNILRKDFINRIELIKDYVCEVEKYEKERVPAIKQRILSRMNEIQVNPDENRLEQELIYYLEKLDITEEKVRLRQHCNYFLETMEKEEYPGKKLGFIAQEIGREINTMGSKANHAEIQKWVVKMKDELEKIKEQSLNIL